MRHSRKKSTVSYLRVVTSWDQLVADPPRQFSPVSGITDDEWLVLVHCEEILAGRYNYWLRHRGPFLSDAELKARGWIPADWSPAKDSQFQRSAFTDWEASEGCHHEV